MLVSQHGILFNAASDTVRAHRHPELDRVLHIFDVYWHGIRSATACLPGHKAAISHKHLPDADALAYLCVYIAKHNISQVCYQGFSENALAIAKFLRNEFGAALSQYVITHVSPAQFQNHFEMIMIREMLNGLKSGVFQKLGSVKPRFSGVVPAFWPKTLINLAPNVGALPTLRNPDTVLIPVENNWRKNLYTNALAGIHCEEITKVQVVNWPIEIANVVGVEKLEWLPFMRPPQILAQVASCAAILHASLIECQPMTQLEGLAVGTPCITARLGVHAEIDQHPLSQLCEVEFADDVGALSQTLTNICRYWRRDAAGLSAMIEDQLELRKHLSMQSYLEFLS
jgi:hypothetical protein